MAYKVRILPTAEEEVDAIVAYLLTLGKPAAKSFTSQYRNQLRLLESGVVDYGLSHPPELAKLGYHSCRVNKYVMLYCRTTDTVVIAHVFHQRRDYARLVLPPQDELPT